MSGKLLFDVIIDGQLESFRYEPDTLVESIKKEILKSHGYSDYENFQFKGADGIIFNYDVTIGFADQFSPQPFYLSLKPGVGA